MTDKVQFVVGDTEVVIMSNGSLLFVNRAAKNVIYVPKSDFRQILPKIREAWKDLGV